MEFLTNFGITLHQNGFSITTCEIKYDYVYLVVVGE